MALFFLLTGIGFVLFVMAVAALVWLVRDGQMDDLETPALRMLGDDVPVIGSPGVADPAVQPAPDRTSA